MRYKYKLTEEQAEKLVENILTAIERRLDEDDYIVDTYLRIHPDDLSVEIMYLEESNLTAPNDDIAVLNFIYDLGGEEWLPNEAAIRCYVNDNV